MLLSFAEAGATVVRLKGGDPLVSYYIESSKCYGSSSYEGIVFCLVIFVVKHIGLSFKVFGRGGEEMDFLQQQGIQVQVIPGTIMNQY